MNNSANSSTLPVVDIALATFNGERHLPEFLASIEKQTYINWHLVAGDDGSTDKTTEILKTFAATHSGRTTLLPGTPPLGIKDNFSRILQACRHDYTALADQDDIWLAGKIKNSVHRIQVVEKEVPKGVPVLVHSDATVTDDNLNVLDQSLWHHQHLCPEYGLKFKNLLVQNVITGCTTMINRALLDLALPIPNESMMHDWWLGLVAAAFGKISYLPEPSLLYRQHAGNQIGAKRWSTRYIAGEAASGLDALRKRIRATQRQAEEFSARFPEHLGVGEQDVLDAYTQLNSHGTVARRLIAARWRFHKCGAIRTIGFYAAL